jgi:outer membrane receptor protein involved in Fe transport
VEWLVGAFNTREDARLEQRGTAFAPDTRTPIPGLNPLLDAALPSHYDEVAVFGDLTYKFTHAFDVTVGMRWSSNDQSFEQRLSGLLVGPPSVAGGKSSDEVTTYMLSARYHLSDDAMAYARVASGYRPGGPNLGLPGVPTTFDADTLVNYELGLKSQLLERRAFLDVAVFRIDWDDIQISDATPSAITFNRNAGEAVSEGFELSGGLLPVEGLRLGMTAAYTDATVSQDIPPLFARKGDHVPSVPQWSGSFTIDYERPLWGELSGKIGGGYRYVGERNSKFPGSDVASSTNPNVVLPAYHAIDASVGVMNRHLTVAMYARNLTNEEAYLSGGTLNVTLLQPRTVGLSVDVQF